MGADLLAYEEDKKKLANVKEKIKTSETLLHRMEFQHEVLQQQRTQVTKERDELYTSFKHDIVSQLEEEVQRIKDSHHTMVKTYESKLAEYGIPPEELGFTPAID